MHDFEKIDEFRREASSALFTKQQAIAVTLNLFERELASGSNSDKEKAILEKAMQKINVRYLDQTTSETDQMLDTLGVARFTSEDIMEAIDAMIFDSQDL